MKDDDEKVVVLPDDIEEALQRIEEAAAKYKLAIGLQNFAKGLTRLVDTLAAHLPDTEPDEDVAVNVTETERELLANLEEKLREADNTIPADRSANPIYTIPEQEALVAFQFDKERKYRKH